MNQHSRRQFLITLACASASLAPLSFGVRPERRWQPSEVDWDTVINDVIRDHNAAMAGVLKQLPSYEVGGPHWCMKRELDCEIRTG